MPDHIHMIVKIKRVEPRKSLPTIVWQISRALSAAYWRAVQEGGGRSRPPQNPGLAPPRCAAGVAPAGRDPRDPVFTPDWHDWIVKRSGQLAAFGRYVRENPERAALRRRSAQYFGRVRTVSFLGREWFAYGNTALLDLPVLVPFKGHRATVPSSPEWAALLTSAARIGPGGAGVSTFMSPLEKACGNAIARAGGSFIVLSPEGFHARWHPPREKERFCAQGKMLFLSLYEASTHATTRKMLHVRCHEMIDLAATGLAR